MKAVKTIRGGIVNLTNIKKELLNREYENLQRYLHDEEGVDLYSANRQQADRYYKDIKEGKEYPLSIRKDLIDIHPCPSDVSTTS